MTNWPVGFLPLYIWPVFVFFLLILYAYTFRNTLKTDSEKLIYWSKSEISNCIRLLKGEDKMSLIIGADLVPVPANQKLFEESNLNALFDNEVISILKRASYRIFNLETPLTDAERPIAKHGPNLRASVKSIAGIKAIGVDLFTLANNHIMDQDVQGLESTTETLNKAEIAHVGAGKNLNEAQKPYFFTAERKQFGVYACTEHEFSVAAEHKPGANPFDPLESLDHIQQMKSHCDFAIVLYHGGKEHYRYPSPYLQKVCRKIVEKGADLVVCQHSHCIGCEEKYQHGTIVYGQGNFLFDVADNEFWNTSLLIQIEDDGDIRYIPICKKGCGVRLAPEKEAVEILAAFRQRSEAIKQPGFLDDQYKAFAETNLDYYVNYFTGNRINLLFRIMNKATGNWLQKKVSERYRGKLGNAVRNFVECEAHRELVIKGLS